MSGTGLLRLYTFATLCTARLIGKPFGLSYEIINKQGEIRSVGHVSKNNNIELTESSMREYQVLPGRMHPNMNMSCGGGGGYLLSTLCVIDCPSDPSLVKKSAGDSNDRRSKKKKVTKTPAEQEPATAN
ncbi:hypothetical protein V8B55DRAFT_1320690 [Mucor lusitanicus]|uniref:tRNA (adenine(58)-N(1))-methyltransferase non-catalytic subunit TRM6 n=2 Tax=Mucor circinelloides f. lusitanicus TaxID=29924 RepID=A0A168K3A6_MUCCL|nr:hypothetical protein FB192DRAFT_1337745 [Mucor lusitanicus]OAD01946.1 hypothetical protein MUCCIDRAFT_82326 [Mucor lusitanicus CBS 277.49]